MSPLIRRIAARNVQSLIHTTDWSRT